MKTKTLLPLFALVVNKGEPYIGLVVDSRPVLPIFSDIEWANSYRRSFIPHASIKTLANLLVAAGYVGAITGYPEVVLSCYISIDPVDDGFEDCLMLDACEFLQALVDERLGGKH